MYLERLQQIRYELQVLGLREQAEELARCLQSPNFKPTKGLVEYYESLVRDDSEFEEDEA
ncbi:MAG: hypothetical protein D6711_14915 [Chloroflexi bacterium]|nr:MAG: hypothetical protein D6711_14915 [Chloroflexota bacterium]